MKPYCRMEAAGSLQECFSQCSDCADSDAFKKAVDDALKKIRFWSQNAWRYEYVVHRNGGEFIVRLEKVR